MEEQALVAESAGYEQVDAFETVNADGISPHEAGGGQQELTTETKRDSIANIVSLPVYFGVTPS